jgi:hypothetical protein
MKDEHEEKCEHLFLKAYTFSEAAGGDTIQMCPRCTHFDPHRKAVLAKKGKL